MNQEEHHRRQLALATIRCRLENDFLAFVCYFFEKVNGSKFQVREHHVQIATILQDAYHGRKKNIIINVAPGGSKTELVILNFTAWCLAKNYKCKFMHISYSDSLGMLHSSKARTIVESAEFQELWGTRLQKDTHAKKMWNVINLEGKKGGGVYATTMQGAITGFRAGSLEKGFQGAILIDDPIKPDDSFSDTIRNHINSIFNTTIESRVASTALTPIIMIMQRVHPDDCTAFALSDECCIKDWHVLTIPALTTGKDGKERSFFPSRVTTEHLQNVRTSSPYTFSSQYQQEPVPLEGGMIKDEHFIRYDTLPEFDKIVQSWDTAVKAKQINDPSVCTTWGITANAYYLIDVYRGRIEYPELKRHFLRLYDAHKPHIVLVEDKSSGQALIQELKSQTRIPIKPIIPKGDKIMRMNKQTGHIEAGKVHIPQNAPWLYDFLNEVLRFPNSKHDDQVDSMSQFLNWQTASRSQPRIRFL